MNEKESIYPDSLMIRDTGIYDDLGGAGQRIYTTAGQGYEKQKYIRADKVQEMLKQQRKACFAKAHHTALLYGLNELFCRDLEDAILNALEEKDE